MKTKRSKMMRKQRRKVLKEVLSRIPPKYHAEVVEKIKDLIQTKYDQRKWNDMMIMLEYYATKG
jgi:hypothetical protein